MSYDAKISNSKNQIFTITVDAPDEKTAEKTAFEVADLQFKNRYITVECVIPARIKGQIKLDKKWLLDNKERNE